MKSLLTEAHSVSALLLPLHSDLYFPFDVKEADVYFFMEHGGLFVGTDVCLTF